MRIQVKKWEQHVPATLDEVWDFFSRPENLNKITPKDMSFVITSDIKGVEMYPGVIICYKLGPIPGIKLNWMTEITHIREREYFVDEQRIGPYKIWHHEHHFEETKDGVLMKDILHYAIPFGFLGTIADRLFVNKKVESIFEYRKKVIDQIFVGS